MRRRYGKQPRPTRCSKRPAHRPGVRARFRGCRGRAHSAEGVSLVLDLPRLTGTFRGYPTMQRWSHGYARSPLRAAFSVLPDALRRDILGSQAAGCRRPAPSVDRRPSRTRRLCCVGSLCAVLDSSSPWTPSSSACRGSGRTCRGVAQSHHGRRGRAGLALRLRRVPHPAGRVADPHPSAHARSRRSRRRRTRRCSMRCGRRRSRTNSPRRSARYPATSAGYRLPRRKVLPPCSRTPTGPDALPRSPDSGR